MKKRNIATIITAILVLLLVFGGCGQKTQQEETSTESVSETTAQTQATTAAETEPTTEAAQIEYTFRNSDLLKSHYKKHGIDMGFDSPEEYLAAANAVIANPEALTKTEREDGDMVYYVEETNEFVVLSTDGYIRTYFYPDSGKRYFDRQ